MFETSDIRPWEALNSILSAAWVPLRACSSDVAFFHPLSIGIFVHEFVDDTRLLPPTLAVVGHLECRFDGMSVGADCDDLGVELPLLDFLFTMFACG